VGPDPEFLYYRQLIVELAEKHRLPALYWYPDFVAAGGLMSYGPDPADLVPQVAAQVRQILNGSKPSEIPVFREDRFPLVLNLKTAHAIGAAFPPSLLAAADKVVE
jgi:putative ABC transport system substrate-binding protein